MSVGATSRLGFVAEQFRIALHALGRRPLRSALNALTTAVAIGTVVTSMALIAGSRAVFERDMRGLGLLTVQVQPDPMGAGILEQTFLDEEKLRELTAVAGDLAEEVVPTRMLQFSARVSDGAPTLVPVIATRPGYVRMQDGGLVAGRWLTEEDERDRRPVVVLDEQAAMLLGGRADLVGETVVLERGKTRHELEVVGVLADPFSMRKQFEQFDTTRGARQVIARMISFQNVYVPLPLLGDGPYTAILLRGRDREGARELGRKIRAWKHEQEAPYFVWRRGRWVETVIDAVSDFALLGSILWALVLLVAMVMIFAVTTVSVRERYREVAIRRTEGATQGAILAQFVSEGMLLSLGGGLFGLGLGAVSAHVLSGVVDWAPRFRTGDMLLALGLAVLVGLGASALPARRASRLDPVAVLSGRRL